MIKTILIWILAITVWFLVGFIGIVINFIPYWLIGAERPPINLLMWIILSAGGLATFVVSALMSAAYTGLILAVMAITKLPSF